jgi:RNA polymerase sigma factor (TIGR02999 family)
LLEEMSGPAGAFRVILNLIREHAIEARGTESSVAVAALQERLLAAVGPYHRRCDAIFGDRGATIESLQMGPDLKGAASGWAEESLTFAVLYDELHALAHRQILRARPGQTLRTTALLHEAYLKLARGAEVRDRHHFFALAAKAMRQVLVDHARAQAAQKRGAGQITTLGEEAGAIAANAAELLAIDTALERLQQTDERLARVVELRFFAGLSVEETAQEMGSSSATVKRDWRAARAFLLVALGSGRP